MKKMKFLASIMTMFIMISMMPIIPVNATAPQYTKSTSANLIVESNIENTGITLKNKTYNLYQVFSATTTDHPDPNQDDAIEYSVNANFYEFFEKQIGLNGNTRGEDVYNHAATDYIDDFKGKEQELVSLLREYIMANSAIDPTYCTADYTRNGTNETVTATNVTLGYYVVFDSLAIGTSEIGTQDVVTNGSLVTIPVRAEDGSLTEDATIALKGSAPSIEKDIWHNDRSPLEGDYSPLLGTTGRWDEVADYQIGDTVEFRLTVELPQDLSAYETYEFIIKDTLSSGLKFNDDIAIYTDKELSTNPVPGKLHKETLGDGSEYTFKMEFDMIDIKQAYPALDTFYVYYTATVTKDAVIANGYENNHVELTFSNNPYNDKSKGSSEDDVYGYTFDLDVIKTKGDGLTRLEGATFGLYEMKTVNDVLQYTQIYLEQNTSASLAVPAYYPGQGDPSDTIGVITTGQEGTFKITGLDDAKNYVLVELQAPSEYNIADPVRIQITASYATSSTGVPTPTISVSGDTSSLDIVVINTSAKLLPETGGIGTTIFTIVGIAIMIGAMILFIIKLRRKF